MSDIRPELFGMQKFFGHRNPGITVFRRGFLPVGFVHAGGDGFMDCHVLGGQIKIIFVV